MRGKKTAFSQEEKYVILTLFYGRVLRRNPQREGSVFIEETLQYLAGAFGSAGGAVRSLSGQRAVSLWGKHHQLGGHEPAGGSFAAGTAQYPPRRGQFILYHADRRRHEFLRGVPVFPLLSLFLFGVFCKNRGHEVVYEPAFDPQAHDLRRDGGGVLPGAISQSPPAVWGAFGGVLRL